MKTLRALFFLLAGSLGSCAEKEDAASAVQPSTIVGTWNLQSERQQITYLNSPQPSTDNTYPLANSSLTYRADGTVTSTNGATTITGTYTLTGTTLITSYARLQAVSAQVAVLTANKLVLIGTTESGSIRTVITTTSTR